jgi:hypothetical protein
MAIVTTLGLCPNEYTGLTLIVWSRAAQIVGKGLDRGYRVEVLLDEKVEIGDISPRHINHIVGFDHDVGAKVTHIGNSLQEQPTADRFAGNALGYADYAYPRSPTTPHAKSGPRILADQIS